MLWGRQRESAAIERLVADARSGRSGALVLRGEPGVGKSALLRHAAAVAGDARVLRGTGIESESELPFAGLHLLLRPYLDRVDALPERQAVALGAALGLARGADGDRFLVGLAVLTLLADLAEERPLLCLIDDAHWLDHASTEVLLFAARRLHAEGIAMIFTARDGHPSGFAAPGLPELSVAGLDHDAAASLLAERAAGLAPQVKARILEEARGNPLALLELPTAFHDGATPARGPGDGLRRAFAHRIADLPAATQRLMAVAAADLGNSRRIRREDTPFQAVDRFRQGDLGWRSTSGWTWPLSPLNSVSRVSKSAQTARMISSVRVGWRSANTRCRNTVTKPNWHEARESGACRA
jgi:hypothetical protein